MPGHVGIVSVAIGYQGDQALGKDVANDDDGDDLTDAPRSTTNQADTTKGNNPVD